MTTQHDDAAQTEEPPAMWLAVNPKAFTLEGLWYRCPICRCLLVDIDQAPHLEAMHSHTADLVLLERRTAAA